MTHQVDPLRSLAVEPGTAAALAARVRDLEDALARERAEGEACRKRLDTLLVIAESTTDSVTTERVFDAVADTILDATGFSAIHVMEFDEENRCYHIVAQRGLPDDVVAEIRASDPLDADRGDFPTYITRTRQPVLTSDHASDPRAMLLTIDRAGFKSLAFVPLLAGERLLGFFCLDSKDEITWDQNEVRWLSLIGREIGLLLEQAQLARQRQAAAAQEERVRLARELHDELLQVLGYLHLKGQMAHKLLAVGQPARAGDEIKEIERVAAQAYDDVRDFVGGLRVTLGPDRDFLAAIEEHVHQFRGRCEAHATLDTSGWSHTHLSREAEIQVLRVLQEALTNVRKHARASHVWITLAAEGDRASACVRDDGVGFDPADNERSGARQFGLTVMRERAESIGADLVVTSTPGQGTAVCLALPARS